MISKIFYPSQDIDNPNEIIIIINYNLLAKVFNIFFLKFIFIKIIIEKYSLINFDIWSGSNVYFTI